MNSWAAAAAASRWSQVARTGSSARSSTPGERSTRFTRAVNSRACRAWLAPAPRFRPRASRAAGSPPAPACGAGSGRTGRGPRPSPEHEVGPFAGGTVPPLPQAEATMPAVQHGTPLLDHRHLGLPHQRAVGEDPHRATGRPRALAGPQRLGKLLRRGQFHRLALVIDRTGMHRLHQLAGEAGHGALRQAARSSSWKCQTPVSRSGLSRPGA